MIFSYTALRTENTCKQTATCLNTKHAVGTEWSHFNNAAASVDFHQGCNADKNAKKQFPKSKIQLINNSPPQPI